LLQRLRRTMTAEVGVIRDGPSLVRALSVIASLEKDAGRYRRLINMLTTAKLITAAAHARKESRGAHFRSDYPQADPKLAKRSMLTLGQACAIAADAAEADRPKATRLAALHA
jgi:L-aspartate oxidase